MLKTFRSFWPRLRSVLRISICEPYKQHETITGKMSIDMSDSCKVSTTDTSEDNATKEKELITDESNGNAITHSMDVTDSSVSQILPKHDQMTSQTETVVESTKRSAEDVESAGDNKKLKLNSESQKPIEGEKQARIHRRKVVMLMVYSGVGYLGMQRNEPFKTIEGVFFEALLNAGLITEEHFESPNKAGLNFQRVSKTDKGVSAAGQVISLRVPFPFEDGLVEKINKHLPEQICILGMKRVTKGFNSKNNCHARTYSYTIPTFAFAPIEEDTIEKFRVTDETMKEVNEILGLYKGTHNFHNFTSGKKPHDRSAYRFIMDFECGPPFIEGDLEFAVIKVKGQSFMIHQIRKLIGLMLAVVRGLATKKSIERAWKPEKCDVPKAPALGLMLEQVHYDQYNKRFGNDGFHEPILWDEFKDKIHNFKAQFIYPNVFKVEKEEKSMMNWLSTLPLHNFEDLEQMSGICQAHSNVERLNKQEKLNKEDVSNQTCEELEGSLNNKVIPSQTDQSEESPLQSVQSEQGAVPETNQLDQGAAPQTNKSEERIASQLGQSDADLTQSTSSS